MNFLSKLSTNPKTVYEVNFKSLLWLWWKGEKNIKVVEEKIQNTVVYSVFEQHLLEYLYFTLKTK